MKTFFKNSELSDQFLKQGYVKVPFLDDKGLKTFKEYVESLYIYFENSNYGICSTTDLGSPSLVKNVNDFVTTHLKPYTDHYFYNYKNILGNYLVKKPVQNTLIPIHQDWTFVDESKYFSLSIWCPLEDVSPLNGNLQVIPQSHRISENLRPSPSYPGAFENIQEAIRPYLIDIPMKAGEAIFYDHALLHASPINHSKNNRSALILGLTHAEAELKHYYLKDLQNGKYQIEEYHMLDDFFIHFNRGSKPDFAPLIRTFDYRFKMVSEREFFQSVNYV